MVIVNIFYILDFINSETVNVDHNQTWLRSGQIFKIWFYSVNSFFILFIHISYPSRLKKVPNDHN